MLLFLVGADKRVNVFTVRCINPAQVTCAGFIPASHLVPAGTDSSTSSLKAPHLQHLKDDRINNHEPITTVEVSLSDLRKCREGEPAHFLVVSRDSAGEQMTRGGEHVMVSIVHKEKKNW